MKRWLLPVLVTACTTALPVPPAPDGGACVRHEVATWHASASFRESERAAIVGAAADWRRVSAGRIDYTVVFDLDADRHADQPQIRRQTPWDLDVLEFERVEGQRRGTAAYHVWGWAEGVRIVLVIGEAPSVRRLAMHELGHAAGLRLPNCTHGDCTHTSDPGALMSYPFTSSDFNKSDLEMCRFSCLCP